ncbi:hypothetical protein S483_004600 [Salmonella enterica subsp. salamae]|nr:hypothetical protein [Salmonella enterica subsp. salamae]
MSQNGLRFTLDVDGLTPTATAVGVNPSSGINSSTVQQFNRCDLPPENSTRLN